MEEFVNFAVKTQSFSYIDDFKPSNIAWDGKKWILIDWDYEHDLFNENNKGNVFTHNKNAFKKMPAEILAEIEKQIGLVRILPCSEAYKVALP